MVANQAYFTFMNNVFTVTIGQTVKINFNAPTGGAKSTLKLVVKSRYSGVANYTTTLLTNSTAGSVSWTAPISLMNLLGVNDIAGLSSLTAELTLTSSGATGTPGLLDETTGQVLLFNPDTDITTTGIVPLISSPTFVDQDAIASSLGVYVIGKSKIKASWSVTYYYHAIANSLSSFTNWLSDQLPVTSTTIPPLIITATDSRYYSAKKTTAVPNKPIYYAPGKPNMSTTYSPDNGDTSATIAWQLARDTDAKFAVKSGNYITLDYSIAGTNTWTVAKAYDTAVASTMIGTHSEVVTGLDPEYPYTFRLTVHTLYGDFSNQIIAQSLHETIDFLKGGKGVSFGQVATKEGFTVYMPAEFTSPSVFDDAVVMKKDVSVGGDLRVGTDTDRNSRVYFGTGLDTSYISRGADSTIDVIGGLYVRGGINAPDETASVSYTGNWQNYNSTGGSFTAHKFGKVVYGSGVVQPSKTWDGSGTSVFGTLPTGFRPVATSYKIQHGTGTALWLLTVQTDGTLTAQRYSNNGTDYNTTVATYVWMPFEFFFIAA